MRLDHDEKIVPKKAEIVPEKAESKASIELSRKIAASGIQNDAFLLANEDQLVANCKKWAKEYPMIQPYFGNYSWFFVYFYFCSVFGF